MKYQSAHKPLPGLLAGPSSIPIQQPSKPAYPLKIQSSHGGKGIQQGHYIFDLLDVSTDELWKAIQIKATLQTLKRQIEAANLSKNHLGRLFHSVLTGRSIE